MEEDRCEDCWWHFGMHGGRCNHPSKIEVMDEDLPKEACGWFEPKLKGPGDVDSNSWEEFQNEWN